MSAPEPVAYQATAIEKIAKALTQLASVDQEEDRLVIFKAPTGSGKTLMVAAALAAAFDQPTDRQFIVLWLSPGAGNLHKQSAGALTGLLAGTSLQVHLLDSQDEIVKYQDPTPGALFVVNWEKLRTEKDGKWANKMLADGENATFFTLLSKTSAKGLDMIVVIDESHTNLGGPQTDKLMTAIKDMRPFIQLELSATPTRKPDPDLQANGVHHWIRVTFDEVEKEGMVRKSVLLNDSFAEAQARHPDDSLAVQVLWAAWERIEALTAGYAAAGSSVKPLLLIQYPDGDKAEARARVVEEFLAARGLKKDVTYAIWLSGEHSDDLDKIASSLSPYRALIFKQAIATGWDCPRAQVLVQFRDPKSPIFQIQTLGRILRSPEQKHYDDEALNLAYVFSDLEGVHVQVETDEQDTPMRDLTVKRRDVAPYPEPGLALHSAFQPRAREFHYPMATALANALNPALDAAIASLLPKDPFDSTPATIVTDARVTARELDAGISRDLTGGKATGDLDDLLVQVLYDMMLVASIGQYRSRAQSLSRIKTIITQWFKKQRPAWSVDQIQHFALRHQAEFIEAIDGACLATMAQELADAIAAARSKRKTRANWEVPATELIVSKEHKDAPAGHLCEPALVSTRQSEPERRFEDWLAQQFAAGVVKWWWKNGESDERYLGVEYMLTVEDTAATKQGEEVVMLEDERITYPDFLVYCADDTVWAIEVKDLGDKDGAPEGLTHAKAKGLAAWEKRMAEQRKKEAKLFARPAVRAGVVVPSELSQGVITVKVGDPDHWTKPDADKLAAGDGWAPLDLGPGTPVETDEN